MTEFIDGLHFILIFWGWIVLLAPFAMAGVWVWQKWEHRCVSKTRSNSPLCKFFKEMH